MLSVVCWIYFNKKETNIWYEICICLNDDNQKFHLASGGGGGGEGGE
jgi:hypothetical protein